MTCRRVAEDWWIGRLARDKQRIGMELLNWSGIVLRLEDWSRIGIGWAVC